MEQSQYGSNQVTFDRLQNPTYNFNQMQSLQNDNFTVKTPTQGTQSQHKLIDDTVNNRYFSHLQSHPQMYHQYENVRLSYTSENAHPYGKNSFTPVFPSQQNSNSSLLYYQNMQHQQVLQNQAPLPPLLPPPPPPPSAPSTHSISPIPFQAKLSKAKDKFLKGKIVLSQTLSRFSGDDSRYDNDLSSENVLFGNGGSYNESIHNSYSGSFGGNSFTGKDGSRNTLKKNGEKKAKYDDLENSAKSLSLSTKAFNLRHHIHSKNSPVNSKRFNIETENKPFGPVDPHSVVVSPKVVENLSEAVIEITGEPIVRELIKPRVELDLSEDVYFTFPDSDSAQSPDKDKESPTLDLANESFIKDEKINAKSLRSQKFNSLIPAPFKRPNFNNLVTRQQEDTQSQQRQTILSPLSKSHTIQQEKSRNKEVDDPVASTLSKLTGKEEAINVNTINSDSLLNVAKITNDINDEALRIDKNDNSHPQLTFNAKMNDNNATKKLSVENYKRSTIPSLSATMHTATTNRSSISDNCRSLMTDDNPSRKSTIKSKHISDLSRNSTSSSRPRESLKIQRFSKTLGDTDPFQVQNDTQKIAQELVHRLNHAKNVIGKSESLQTYSLIEQLSMALNVLLKDIKECQKEERSRNQLDEQSQTNMHQRHSSQYSQLKFTADVEIMNRHFDFLQNLLEIISGHQVLAELVQPPQLTESMLKWQTAQHQLKDLQIRIPPPYRSHKVAVRGSVYFSEEDKKSLLSDIRDSVRALQQAQNGNQTSTVLSGQNPKDDMSSFSSQSSKRDLSGDKEKNKYNSLSNYQSDQSDQHRVYENEPSESTLELNQLSKDLIEVARCISMLSKNPEKMMKRLSVMNTDRLVRRLSRINPKRASQLNHIDLKSKPSTRIRKYSAISNNSFQLTDAIEQNVSGLYSTTHSSPPAPPPSNPLPPLPSSTSIPSSNMRSQSQTFKIDSIPEPTSTSTGDCELTSKMESLRFTGDLSEFSESSHRPSMKSNKFTQSLVQTSTFSVFNKFSPNAHLDNKNHQDLSPYNQSQQPSFSTSNLNIITPPLTSTNNKFDNPKSETSESYKVKQNLENLYMVSSESKPLPSTLSIPESSISAHRMHGLNTEIPSTHPYFARLTGTTGEQNILQNPQNNQSWVSPSHFDYGYKYDYDVNEDEHDKTSQNSNTNNNHKDSSYLKAMLSKSDIRQKMETKFRSSEKQWKRKLKKDKSNERKLFKQNQKHQKNNGKVHKNETVMKRNSSKSVNHNDNSKHSSLNKFMLNPMVQFPTKRPSSLFMFQDLETKYKEGKILGIGRYSEVYVLKNFKTNQYYAGKSILRKQLKKRLWMVRNEFAVLRRITSEAYDPYRLDDKNKFHRNSNKNNSRDSQDQENDFLDDNNTYGRIKYQQNQLFHRVKREKVHATRNAVFKYLTEPLHFHEEHGVDEKQDFLFFHPNLTYLVDMFLTADSFYFVMPLALGPTLREYLEEIGGPINEATTRIIMKQLVSAVRFMYDRGIAHRNLTLDNIIFKKQIGGNKSPFSSSLLSPRQPDRNIFKKIDDNQSFPVAVDGFGNPIPAEQSHSAANDDEYSQKDDCDFEVLIVDLRLAKILDTETDYYYAELLNIELNEQGRLDPTVETLNKMKELQHDQEFFQFWVGSLGVVDYMPPEQFELCENCRAPKICGVGCKSCLQDDDIGLAGSSMLNRSNMSNDRDSMGASQIDFSRYVIKHDSRPGDMWALGVIMFALLSNSFPFSSNPDNGSTNEDHHKLNNEFGNQEKGRDTKRYKRERSLASKMETYSRIMNSKYDFTPIHVWDQVSVTAKLFLEECLMKNVSNRISAGDSVKHSFFKSE